VAQTIRRPGSAVTGPDFISLQVRDLGRSAAFYERYLGLKRSDAGPPHAVVFDTKPIVFAVRDALAAAGATIVSAPVDGPFGRTFTFADPDGYQVTLHDRG